MPLSHQQLLALAAAHGVAQLVAEDAITKAARSAATADREARRTAEQAAMQAAVAELRAAHPQLEAPTRERDALITAARNLRAQLKARWPGVKFTVTTKRYTGGSSLSVRWIDGPAVSLVDAIADRYQAGRFDGQTDCYDYSDSAWTRAFGEAKYVFTARDYSPAALEWAKAQFGDEDRGRYHGPAHLSALRDLSIKRIKRGA